MAEMSPTDKLIHDLVVLLVDAATRLSNAAEFKEIVPEASAKEIRAATGLLTDRWVDLKNAPWSCGHTAAPMCSECYQRLANTAHELAEENLRLRAEMPISR